MKKNKNIVLLCLDLGYRVFDNHFQDFPDRCFNLGASEQAGLGIAVGMALSGKIPFIYSITNFLIYRPFETIRNYLNWEKIPVKLIASGRDKDYLHDGISHWSEDCKKVLSCFENIVSFFPEEKEEIPEIVKKIIKNKKPSFLSLKRG